MTLLPLAPALRRTACGSHKAVEMGLSGPRYGETLLGIAWVGR